MLIVLLLLATAAPLTPQLPTVTVTSDDTVIDQSCRVVIPEGTVLSDSNGNGVVHIVASNITVDFRGSVLRGAPAGTAGDQLSGLGIRLDGQSGVVLKNLDVRGFKVGLSANNAERLTIHRARFHDNFRQRLRSTPRAENTADWLYPHHNDRGEWADRYGAAIWLRSCTEPTIRNVEVRRTQNGILLDRTHRAKIYDNDASFLSGWGLALWRSCDNVITRNAFDFCIRGYSHGVYNRGQDSAGLLMFEQCSRNTIAENSITHGGDGIFAFAGREALGEGTVPDGFSHLCAGNNDNIIVKNDTSYAAAHGIELTFSFGNRIALNRVFENAICGIWGGYSQETLIAGNHFERNGDAGYGLERGGVNIEHSVDNVIHDNKFVANACGVHLWWDPDPELAKTPWAKAQRVTCEGNRISHNGFYGDPVAIHLREATATTLADNKLTDVETPLRVDGGEAPIERVETDLGWKVPEYTVLGRTRPVGNRRALGGREAIVMTEWGPWDHQTPLVRRAATGQEDVYEVHGVAGVTAELLDLPANAADRKLNLVSVPSASGGAAPVEIRISAKAPGLHPYRVRISGTDGFERTVAGRVLVTNWTVRVFRWTRDPREDLAGWRAESESALTTTRGDLQLEYGMGGPRTVGLSDEIRANGPGPDRFGTIAETTIPLAAGRYRIVTWSDDGIRVTADGAVVVEDWTWHGPTMRAGSLVLDSPREVRFEVEHFEIDGFATLRVDIEPEISSSEGER